MRIYPNMLLVLFSLLCSGMQFWISCTTLIGHYIGSAFVYMADFLLVNIYTLGKYVSIRSLSAGISVGVADLALFNA